MSYQPLIAVVIAVVRAVVSAVARRYVLSKNNP
jgi:hypothetical protein